ncbi:MAG TPA: DNA-3-methyladenine glycosylase I [Acetobacteraceae bacterium]|nr:DNA-3-methyladenine glycosylase I [Acetobacteraceae bacterium]
MDATDDGKPRCAWAMRDPLMRDYHDREWGRPLHGDAALFELLSLEGAQAGLSWRTVLVRREAYRRAFHCFDLAAVAAMGDAEIAGLGADAGLIRHAGKLASVRDNARAALATGGLDGFLWGFVEGRPIVNHWTVPGEVPARTDVSDRMARELRKRGFRFAGSTICYAFMQASGMVNDHLMACFRRSG